MTNDTDANDPTKYKRLAASLRAQITDGTIARGGPAPTVTDLAAGNGWSRQTCARALGMLAREGLLTRYPGLGYYVTGTTAPPGGP